MQPPLQPDPTTLDDCNVFVKYLPPELTEPEFNKMFQPFGQVISSKIMVDQSGKSLGYGFVRFSSPEVSGKAISAMNGRKVANKRLLCKLANQSPATSLGASSEFRNPLLRQQLPSDNIYIKPLLLSTTEADLLNLFGKFGKIIECKVMVDKNTGISHQIGFVRFETTDQAKDAIQAMNNYKLHPTSPPLVVKYADTKEQKDARKTMRQQLSSSLDEFDGAYSPVFYYSPTTYPYSYPGYTNYEEYGGHSPVSDVFVGSYPSQPYGYAPYGYYEAGIQGVHPQGIPPYAYDSYSVPGCEYDEYGEAFFPYMLEGTKQDNQDDEKDTTTTNNLNQKEDENDDTTDDQKTDGNPIRMVPSSPINIRYE